MYIVEEFKGFPLKVTMTIIQHHILISKDPDFVFTLVVEGMRIRSNIRSLLKAACLLSSSWFRL